MQLLGEHGGKGDSLDEKDSKDPVVYRSISVGDFC
jgi:hypothetical protein